MTLSPVSIISGDVEVWLQIISSAEGGGKVGIKEQITLYPVTFVALSSTGCQRSFTPPRLGSVMYSAAGIPGTFKCSKISNNQVVQLNVQRNGKVDI